jgi:hypothetical protein
MNQATGLVAHGVEVVAHLKMSTPATGAKLSTDWPFIGISAIRNNEKSTTTFLLSIEV